MMDSQSQLNYRQSGKRVDFGILHRGFVSSPSAGHASKSAASIPSRFETIINPLPKESRAFGSQAQRFKANETQDLPGPGAYGDLPTMLNKSDSFSKKGYGNGFISKNQRFVLDYERIARPSPAAYNIESHSRRPSSSLAGTAPFLATGHPGADSVELRRSAERPGPGSYELNAPEMNHIPKSNSAFRSTDTRFRYSQSLSPAPGQYEIPGTVNLDRNPGSFLKSKAERVTATILSDNPGVGEYHLPALVGESSNPYPNGNFVQNSLDRFGKPVNSVHSNEARPGPGAYEPNLPKSSYKGMVSAFASQSVRLAESSNSVPGPAFYSPIQVAKKSFHLTTKPQWVS